MVKIKIGYEYDKSGVKLKTMMRNYGPQNLERIGWEIREI